MDEKELEREALYYKALEDYKDPSPEKHDEALAFLKQAAEAGNKDACKMLGVLMISGQYAPFPEKNEEEAVRWYLKASQLGDEEAMYWLSQCYDMGIGVTRSHRQAKKWRRDAIAHGFVPDDGQSEETAAEETVPEVAVPEVAVPEMAVPVMELEKDQEPPEMAPATIQQPEATEQPPKAETTTETTETAETAPEEPEEAEPAVEIQAELKENTTEPVRRYSQEEGRKTAHELASVHTAVEVEHEALDHPQYEGALTAGSQKEDEARQKANQHYRSMVAFSGGVLGAVIGGAIFCVLVVVLNKAAGITLSGNIGVVLWAVLGVLAVAGLLIGLRAGRHVADQKIREVGRYRKTAFYRGFGCELGHMDRREQWLYALYQSLERDYDPLSQEVEPDMASLRQYRGAMLPGWKMDNSKGRYEAPFSVVTGKAVYVVNASYVEGTLSGSLQDETWQVKDENGRVKEIPNLIRQNAASVEALKQALADNSDLAMEQVPFFSVVIMPEKADIHDMNLTGVEGRVLFSSGAADRTRSLISRQERDLRTCGISVEKLVRVCVRAGKTEAVKKA